MRVVFALTAVAALGSMMSTGCKERASSPPSTATRAPARPSPGAPAAKRRVPPSRPTAVPGAYKAVKRVGASGTIAGRVVWKGPRPKLSPLPVRTDRGACGGSKASNRLVIDAGGGVKNAIVSLVDIRKGKLLDIAREARLDQVRCRYVPHVQVVPVGGRLTAINSDPVLHNVHAYLGATTVFNLGMPLKGQRIPRKIVRPGLMEVSCDAGHTWMSAYVLAVEHPYHVVTDRTGAYKLTEVPPGTYRIRMWHEGWNVARRSPEGRSEYTPPRTAERTVTVTAGKTTTVDFGLADR